MTADSAAAEDSADLFSRIIDGQPVNFVRPIDATSAMWVAYVSGRPLGALSLERDGAGALWRVQATHQRYRQLDDAVRALRTR